MAPQRSAKGAKQTALAPGLQSSPDRRRSAPAVMGTSSSQNNRCSTTVAQPSAVTNSNRKRKAGSNIAMSQPARKSSTKREAPESSTDSSDSRAIKRQRQTAREPPAATNNQASVTESASQDEAAPIATILPPPETFTDGLPLPKFIVFDLDFTIWPFNIDWPVTAPYSSLPGGQKVRGLFNGKVIEQGLHPEVPSIFFHIQARRILMGVASKDPRHDLVTSMLGLLTIPGLPERSVLSVLPLIECHRGSKKVHFAELQRQCGFPYTEMVFYDDRVENRDVETLGVVMQTVHGGKYGGLNMAKFDEGIRLWRTRNYRTQRQ